MAQALQANDSSLAPLQVPVAVLTAQQPTERQARMEQRLQSASANFSFFAGLNGSQKIPELEARARLRARRQAMASAQQQPPPILTPRPCCKQKTDAQRAREQVSWGLDIDALKTFTVVPTTLCENTTSQHYACTISHMLLIYKAYMANEVRTSLHSAFQSKLAGGPLSADPMCCKAPSGGAECLHLEQRLSTGLQAPWAGDCRLTAGCAAEHATGAGGRHGDPALAHAGPGDVSARGLGNLDAVQPGQEGQHPVQGGQHQPVAPLGHT